MLLLNNKKEVTISISRLDFLIQTFFGALFTMLACDFPILHHLVLDQVICLEDQSPLRLEKQFPTMKAPAKFMLFLEGTHLSGKYLL